MLTAVEQKIVEEIKRVILDAARDHEIKVRKIILFGSRARGEARTDSDWDIMVVVDKSLTRSVYWKFYLAVKRRLAKSRIPNDIVVVPKSLFERKRRIVGNIAYEAYSEGVTLWTEKST